MNPVENLGMNDVRDVRGVPVSGGIPPIVRVAAAIGFVLILIVIGMVIAESEYGHRWPASNTLTIPLTDSGAEEAPAKAK